MWCVDELFIAKYVKIAIFLKIENSNNHNRTQNS